jgi:hypothetical protein
MCVPSTATSKRGHLHAGSCGRPHRQQLQGGGIEVGEAARQGEAPPRRRHPGDQRVCCQPRLVRRAQRPHALQRIHTRWYTHMHHSSGASPPCTQWPDDGGDCSCCIAAHLARQTRHDACLRLVKPQCQRRCRSGTASTHMPLRGAAGSRVQRSAEGAHLQDEPQLLGVAVSREQGLSRRHLHQHAACTIVPNCKLPRLPSKGCFGSWQDCRCHPLRRCAA